MRTRASMFTLKNNSSYVGKEGGTEWWDWTAYIEAQPPNSLDEVDYVEYHLHSSFRNPVVRIRVKQGGFPFNTKGWGTFALKARVVFKDKNQDPTLLSHDLDFVEPT